MLPARPQYPNATDDPACNSSVTIGEGLLYDLENDPGEYTSVAKQNPGPFATIKARMAVVQKTFFNPTRGDDNGMGAGNQTAAKFAVARGGYWGPFIFP